MRNSYSTGGFRDFQFFIITNCFAGANDSFFNFFISRTAAQMRFDGFSYFFNSWLWVVMKKDFCSTDKSGRAKTTLDSSFIYKRFGNSIQYVIRKAFRRIYLCILQLFHFYHTRQHGLPIYFNCTSATSSLS